MNDRRPGRLRIAAVAAALAVGLGLTCPLRAGAQEPSDAGIGGLITSVVLDPTTYAPAVIAYDATMRDWNTSQVFFQHGYRERNPRFTLSGRPNDTPVSYEVGRRRIVGDGLLTLQASLLNNVSTRLVERMLVKRFPHRRTLVRTVGWIERIAFASVLSYRLSVQHYRQANHNTTLARHLGYR